ncbi:insulinase family protein [Alteromonas sp.]|uniref:insulinase family protein n=1 Tax=Alteromonas sp. TaxID=232 RepID=UPI000B75B502|nr:insulinase family protein [Alteromonas sp.]MAI36370.1 peptidase M16 [Alteromonas sp.]OUX91304.1 MAG: peptidase M16 [Alteromonas sp. TMED35]|tara:strand:- start:13102 stop:15849 length:2748 start_codon:yes stop_codon:yes gene_type:complete
MKNTIKFENAHHITLPNGLRVMACHTPDAEEAHVSIAVRSGHFYDPHDCHGLAHLLEHMLFMGSRHFPKPNAINDFIEQHGGTLNAWTGTEYANYHYSCHAGSLAQTLPGFADILRQPLFEELSISNEVKNIHAEFEFKKKDDLRRLYQIHKETCNPQHPFSKFSVGNSDTFSKHTAGELKQRLKAMHNERYCGNNLCLCIASPMPIDQINALIHQCFDSFTAGELADDQWPPLYRESELGIQINIQPLQSAKRMIVTFALPPLQNDYECKPLNYISHLIGDEGEGSLLAFLKERDWALNLIAGAGIEGDGFKDFNVSFQLTNEGLACKYKVLQALFSYIELIKQASSEQWRYQEKAQLDALALEYEENIKPLNLITEYAQHQFVFSPKELNKLRSTIGSFDHSVILNALSHLKPANLRLKVISKDVPADKTCAFYEAKYSVEDIPLEVKASLNSPSLIDKLELPPPNPYLGNEYQLVLPESGFHIPNKLIDKQGYQFWFAQDQQFHSPKGDIYISFDATSFSESLTAVAAKRIWLGALNDHLQAKYYRAEIAGLHYRIYGHQAGFTLHTRGFTNQQPLLASQLMDAVINFIPDERAFSHHKYLQEQALHNSLLNKPTNRLFSRLSVLIQRNTQAPIELLDVMSDTSYDDMLVARESAFKQFFAEAFMHGNWTSNEAEQFATSTYHLCKHSQGSPLSRAVSKLPVGDTLYHQVSCKHDDGAVVLYLQAPSASLSDTALCMVLEQMLAAPFFNSLRTEQQLGYIVGTGYVPHNQHPGIAFYIQSPEKGPKPLLEAMTTFLYQQLHEIEFYRFYWPTIQENLLKQLEERDLTLSMKSQRLWVSLGTQDLEFNRNLKLAECVKKLSFEHIQGFADQLAKRERCGEIVLYSDGKFDPMPTCEKRTINSIAEFKQKIPYH